MHVCDECSSDLMYTTTCTWYLIKSIKEVEFRNSSLNAKTEHYLFSVEHRKLNYYTMLLFALVI